MYRIAFCDDEEIILKKINAMVTREFNINEIEAESFCYKDAKSLLKDHLKGPFDVLFLDIEMPEVDGFQLASEIRKTNDNVFIVFVTSKTNLVHKSLDFQPFHFVRKDVMETELPEVIVKLIKKLISRHKTILFNQKTTVTKVRIRDIYYVESIGNYMMVYTKQGKMSIRGTLKSRAKELLNSGFIKIHKSYMVNYHYVKQFDTDSVLLDNNMNVPMSRSRKKEALDIYLRLICR